jgi:DNA polymerase type B, organellar and viral
MQGYIPKRVPHIIRVAKTTPLPTNLLFFDTETKTQRLKDRWKTERQTLDFGCIIAFRFEGNKQSRRISQIFNCIDSFWSIVNTRLQPKKPLFCFAHNLGFDATIIGLWEEGEERGLQIDQCVDDDPPTFVIGKMRGCKIVFIDTLNYWRQSLAKLGDAVGLPKIEIDLSKALRKEKETYCIRDTEIIAKSVTGLMRYLVDNDLGGWAFSQASLAFKSYRHKFMRHKIYIHNSRRVCSMERNAYYGGRVECFFIGVKRNQPIYKLDVNSMYPFVMQNNYPVKLIDYEECPSLIDVQRRLKRQGAIAECCINTTRETFPCYAADKLYFPIGRYKTTLCGPELQHALTTKSITSIEGIAWYEMKPIFREFVSFFWRERQRYQKQGDSVREYFAKIFMNSLYGKFGQRGLSFVVLTPVNLERFYEINKLPFPKLYKVASNLYIDCQRNTRWFPMGLKRPLSLKRIGEDLLFRVDIAEHTESFPAISAYCTSYAREMLRGLMATAGQGEYFYCDTDSLFVSQRGYNRMKRAGLIDSKTLGKLKLESEERYARFNTLKDYSIGAKVTRKGVRKDARQLARNEWEQIQFEGLRTILNRGGVSYVDIRHIRKRLSGDYTKGKVNSAGMVAPFRFPLASLQS